MRHDLSNGPISLPSALAWLWLPSLHYPPVHRYNALCPLSLFFRVRLEMLGLTLCRVGESARVLSLRGELRRSFCACAMQATSNMGAQWLRLSNVGAERLRLSNVGQ